MSCACVSCLPNHLLQLHCFDPKHQILGFFFDKMCCRHCLHKPDQNTHMLGVNLFSYQRKNHPLPPKQKQVFIELLLGSYCTGFPRKFYDAKAFGTSSVITDNHSSFNITKEGEGLVQQLIRAKRADVVHAQGWRLGCKAHADNFALAISSIQGLFCRFSIRSCVLLRNQQITVLLSRQKH